MWTFAFNITPDILYVNVYFLLSYNLGFRLSGLNESLKREPETVLRYKDEDFKL